MKHIKISDRYPLGMVFVFVTLCLLPVLILRDFSPSNELRYLSIADEAIRDGHFFAFFNHGLAYADKPPLYFWLIMLCRVIFGGHYMLPLALFFSLVPAFVIVKTMDTLAGPARNAERIAVALMLMTCLMFLGMSVFLRMDMLMCMFIVLALSSFWKLYKGIGNTRIQKWLLPFWVFMALFTKGPVGLLVPPVAIAVFLAAKKEFRNIGKYLGLRFWSVLLGLSAVWILLAYLEGGKDYINNLLFHQTIDRAHDAFHHKQPVWYYLALIWFTVAPYCLLTIGCLIASFFKAKKSGNKQAMTSGQFNGDDADAISGQDASVTVAGNASTASISKGRSDLEIFMVCIVLSVLVMLSSFSSKLAIYLAPAFPFIVYLFPLVLKRFGYRKWMGWAMGIPAFILGFAGLAALFILTCMRSNELVNQLVTEYHFLDNIPILIGIALITIASWLSFDSVVTRKPWTTSVFLLCSGMLVAFYCIGTQMESVNDFMGYGNICSQVPEDGEVVAVRMRRPENMDVYLHREVVDFQKDAAGFDAYEQAHPEKTICLMVPVDKLDKAPELERFLSSARVTKCGPYILATRRKTE